MFTFIYSFQGTVIIIEAESRQAIIDLLKADIDYKEGVWDLDNFKITPMSLMIVRGRGVEEE